MYMKPLSNIVLKGGTCQINKQEILHTGVGFHELDSGKKHRETKFQLVYINQVNSVDKNSFRNSLKYSSSFFNLENKSKIKCTVAYRTQIHRLKQECLDL